MFISDAYLCLAVDVSIREDITHQAPLSGVTAVVPPGVNALMGLLRYVGLINRLKKRYSDTVP